MAFSSVQFLFVFLPLSLAVYWLCPKWLRNAVLAAFSLLFFAWAGLKGAAILVLLAGINWLGGLSLGRLAHKRPLLILLILLDLAVLGGFKYAGFAAETVNALVPGLLPVLSPALPLGLSFYVFTAIGYCADVAAGKVESEKNPIRFAVFLAFFGHGPSGPIVRYGQQAPQLDPGSETRRVSADRFCYGIKRLVLGLAKKAIIADQLALIYAKVASVPAATLPAPILVLGYTAYMMQLYFDFSGYSDMAIGIGEFFGITLPENFEYPYLACSVGEYWRRWHISLSSWFRDYVYFSLGGSRCAPWRHYLNIVIVFVCSGLWHGADWRYLAWGLFTGLLAAFGVMTAKLRKKINRYNPLYRMGWFKVLWQCLFTNALFCLTLVFFASAIYNTDPFAVYSSLLQGWDGLAGSWAQVSNLIYSSGIDGRLPVVLLFGCFVVFAAEHKGRSVARWIRQQVWPLRWTLYYGMAAAILFFAAFGQSAFIYQQY